MGDKKRKLSYEELLEKYDALVQENESLRDALANQNAAEVAIARYEELLALSTDIMSFVDAGYIYRAVNDAYLTAYNLSRDQIIGRPVPELLGDEIFNEVVKPNLDRCLHGEDVFYEHWFVHPEWGRTYRAVEYRPFREKNGAITGVIVHSRDLTKEKEAEQAIKEEIEERRKAEAMLKLERDRLYRVLDGLPGYVYVQRQDLLVVFTNRVFRELFGNAVGRPCFEVLHGRTGRCLDCHSKDVFERNIPLEMEWSNEAGHTYHVYSYPFEDIDGTPLVLKLGIDITERKIMEENLRISESRLQMALNATNDGYWDRNLATGEIYYSPRWFTLLGYEPNELPSSGETFFSLLHPDDMAITKESIEQLSSGAVNDYQELEFRMRCKNGEWIWVLGRGRVVARDEEGRPTRLMGTHLDITERKAAEEALRRSEERFRIIADYTYDWESWIDNDNSVLWVNPAVMRMTGYSPVECFKMQDYPMPFVPDKYSNVVETMREQARAGRPGNDVPLKIKTKTGEELWAAISWNPIFGVDDEPMGYRTSIRDISTRKHAEETLLLQKMRLETLQQLNKMAGVSLHEIFEFVLEEGLKLTKSKYGFLGFLSEDKTTMTVHAWSKGVFRDCRMHEAPLHFPLETAGVWAEGIKRGKTYIENNYVAGASGTQGIPPGHVEIARLISVPVLDQDNVVAFVAVANRDSRYDETDGVQLTLLMDGMWHHIKRRQANDELLQAKDAAERASRAKGEFLANMSHEVRTPISGIIGMTEMVLSLGVRDDQRQYLEMVKDSSRSLLTIINDILDLSKVEAKKLELSIQDFSLKDVLEKQLNTFMIHAVPKGNAITLDIAEDTPLMLRGDPDRLQQIVGNLLSNASKFTEKGRIHVSVSTKTAQSDAESGELRRRDTRGTRSVGETTIGQGRRGEDSVELLFTVSDTGIGIPPEIQSKIFTSFTQADGSYSKKYPGTGLGLSISKALVNMMGGRIWVESEQGGGSTFSFTVWLELSPLDAPVQEAPQHDKSAGEGRALRILLADDNDMNRTFMGHFLTKRGHNVTMVSNGREALQALENGSFDCVLMDVQMPEMDGVEATRHIRAGAAGAHVENIPIIALTAYAMKGDKERFLEAGMNRYVSKPVEMEELINAVNGIMQGREDTESAGSDEITGSARYVSEVRALEDDELLDMGKLEDSFMGKGPLFTEMKRLFIESCETNSAMLRTGFKKRDLEIVAKAAHSLVNSAVVLRSPLMAAQGRDLEHAARSGDMTEAKREYVKVKASIRQIMDQLQYLDFQ